MSLKDCIRSAAKQGAITREEAEQLEKKYDDLVKRLFSPAAAKQQMIDELTAERLEKRRRALLTEARRTVLEAAILGHKNAKGKLDPIAGLQKLVESFGYSKADDLVHQQKVIVAGVHAEMEEILDTFRKGALTGDLRRNQKVLKARMDNVVRELDGQDTGDVAAKHIAGMWAGVSDRLRQEFNAAGGAIAKLKKWMMPQHHDQSAMLAAGVDNWVQFITPLLDRNRMLHPLSKQAMTDAELDASLRYIWKNVTENGWLDREPSGRAGGAGALFGRHADHRFLMFKDADAWLKYQRQFGEADAYAAMMGYISTMSRDIAAMRVLGPNPDHMFRYLMQVAEKAAVKGKARALRRGLYRAENMWLLYKGTTNTPVDVTAANVMAAVRNTTSATALGSALLSSISDFVTDGFARRMNGLPVTRSLTGMIAEFKPSNRREAVRSWLNLDSAQNVMMSQGRYVKSLQAARWSAYLADRNIALQGLSAWTQARKHAFGKDFQGAWADNVKTEFGKLELVYRRVLERHGITSDEWDKIRAVRLYEPKPGATYLRPNEIHLQASPELARKWISMILRETRRSTIEGSLYSRAGGFGGVGRSQPGTFLGEVARTAAQFRAYAATFVMMQAEVIAHKLHEEGLLSAGAYTTAFVITSMLAGSAALQLKNIAAGRDPQDWGTKEFWLASLVQSGGLGIYGDFFTGGLNRFGGGIAGTVLGPSVDKIDNIWKLTGGNFIEFATDEKTNAGRELARFLERNTPLASTLWYTKLAYNRLLTDQVHYLLDPDARKAFKRRIAAREKQFGNSFWWAPGEAAPRRAPDLGGP